MKKIWKKYLVVLSTLVLLLSLTACSSDKKDDTISFDAETEKQVEDQIRQLKAQGYQDMTVTSYIRKTMDNVISTIEQYYINADRKSLEKQVKEDEELYAAEASYLEATEGLGEYEKDSAYDLTFELDGKNISVTGTISFEKRDVMFSLSQNGEDETTTLTFEKDLTLGEILKKAGINTLLGMGTVFLVLILISLIIYCLGFVSKVEKPVPVATPAPVPAPVLPEPEEEDVTDDLELVAVISAAIATAEGTSADGFVVRSIKRVNPSKRRRA